MKAKFVWENLTNKNILMSDEHLISFCKDFRRFDSLNELVQESFEEDEIEPSEGEFNRELADYLRCDDEMLQNISENEKNESIQLISSIQAYLSEPSNIEIENIDQILKNLEILKQRFNELESYEKI